jgi:AcrR family transcriptional regulator
MARTSERHARRDRGGGRPLDPSRDAAILRAALEGLAELGYDRLSMDEIAARARAGKGALYRRWPSKAALVVDAVIAWRDQFAPTSIPDTGSLSGDLEALIDAVPDFDETAKRQVGVVVGLAAAASRDPELRAALGENALQRPRQILGEVLARAVARGEIAADRDLELIPDLLVGLNLLRGLLLGEVPDRRFVRQVVETIIHPLVTAPATKTRRRGSASSAAGSRKR